MSGLKKVGSVHYGFLRDVYCRKSEEDAEKYAAVKEASIKSNNLGNFKAAKHETRKEQHPDKFQRENLPKKISSMKRKKNSSAKRRTN